MKNSFIAVLDSGMGGISVLKELAVNYPSEKFLYLGDASNAPYGNKSDRELLSITFKNIDYIKSYPIKALVLGCNTLSVNLRSEIENYANVPVFGVYPPVEQALIKGGKVLLLATVRTAEKYFGVKNLDAVGLKGLAYDIEYNMFNLNKVNLIDNIKSSNVDFDLNMPLKTVVLGCTHYYFIKNKIFDHFRPQNIIGGNHFTAKMVKNFLVKSKSLGNSYGFSVSFIGDNAKLNEDFFNLSGQTLSK